MNSFSVNSVYTSGLINSIACDDQQQSVLSLMDLFENGGFLRQSNGLNSLDSIKQLAKILNIPEFKFQIQRKPITDVCRNSKDLFNLLLANLFRKSSSTDCHFD